MVPVGVDPQTGMSKSILALMVSLFRLLNAISFSFDIENFNRAVSQRRDEQPAVWSHRHVIDAAVNMIQRNRLDQLKRLIRGEEHRTHRDDRAGHQE